MGWEESAAASSICGCFPFAVKHSRPAHHRAWLEASPSPSRPADASLPPALAHGQWPRLSCEGSYISGLHVLQSDMQW